MDAKLLARAGAAVFVGFACAMTLVQLREQPSEIGKDSDGFQLPGHDALKEQLRACGQIGQDALSAPQCREAWAENRRRFLEMDYPHAHLDRNNPVRPSAQDNLLSHLTGNREGED